MLLRPFEPSERWAILGTTGSGKSRAAGWVAYHAPPDYPFIFIDSKEDALPLVKGYTVKAATRRLGSTFRKLPRVLRVVPAIDESDDEFDALFKAQLRREDVGVIIDEAYMVPEVPWYKRVLTTGRSKDCALIICSQRPVDIPRVCISEATRFMVFTLVDRKDRDRIAGFAPIDPKIVVDRFSFCYYDSKDGALANFPPLPNRDWMAATAAKRS